MEQNLTCRYCQFPITETFFFCPSCGKKLKEKPPSTTLASQIIAYLISFLLPPLGIFRALPYLRQPDTTSKIIGVMCLLLTAFSLYLSIMLAFQVANTVNKTLSTELNIYQ